MKRSTTAARVDYAASIQIVCLLSEGEDIKAVSGHRVLTNRGSHEAAATFCLQLLIYINSPLVASPVLADVLTW